MDKTLYSKQGAVLRDWLKQQRIDAGLSMRDLGKRLATPHQFIAKVENGERRLDVVEYVVYCRALQCDLRKGIEAIERSL